MGFRIYRSPEEARGQFGPCVLSIGNFDGVHCGHRRLFERVVQKARSHGWKAGVLTFDPHPTKVVAPERAPQLLSTVEQRCAWIREAGIDEVCILPFDRAIASLSPEEFVRRIVAGMLDARVVMVGDNFRFGNKQAGDIHTLVELGAQYGFQAEALHAVKLRGCVISSSEIRKRILSGEMEKAARMLGRFYSVEGNVVKGHGIGAKQTVPTLNIAAEAEVLPGTGVYVSRTLEINGPRSWPSITNVGYRPTFDGDALSIETFLLNALEGETPERIRVELTHRLRDERRFADAVELRAQILKDVARAKAWHRRLGKWSGELRRYTGN